MINPLGFTLEHFDATGRFRKTENGKKIDASGSYALASGGTATFTGARDLARFLAENEDAQRAFTVQLFHHAVKQPVFAYGTDTPAKLRQAFEAAAFTMRGLLVEIAARSALFGTEFPK
jgi:hypothetical protein